MADGGRLDAGGLSPAAEAGLQRLIDAFCRTADRLAGFDDERLKLLIYGTSATAPVRDDVVHYHSALHRTATPAVLEWVNGWRQQSGVDGTDRPLRLPANRELAMVSRLCMPIGHEDAVLGYLWVIDPDENLPPEHLDLMVRTARAAAAILHDDRQRLKSRQAIAHNLIDDLLTDNPVLRARAVKALADKSLFPPDSDAIAIAIRYRAPADMDTPWAADALGAAAQDFVDSLSPGLGLSHTQAGSTLVVVSPLDPILRDLDPAGLGGLVLDTIEKDRLPSGSTEVGVARPHRLLELAAAAAEAKRAVDVGRRLEPDRRVFGWSDLGVYRLIGRYPLERITEEDFSQGLRELLKEERAEYRETLETYLDQAGDVQAVAASLGIHRATVYYRLHRAQQLLGTDLTDGEALLELHLGLKLARIKPAPGH